MSAFLLGMLFAVISLRQAHLEVRGHSVNWVVYVLGVATIGAVAALAWPGTAGVGVKYALDLYELVARYCVLMLAAGLGLGAAVRLWRIWRGKQKRPANLRRQLRDALELLLVVAVAIAMPPLT